MTGDDEGVVGGEVWRRRREAAASGHRGDVAAARRYLADASGPVRATALGALSRLGRLTAEELDAALSDPDPRLRVRACEVAAGRPDVDLVPLLADADASVAEVAAWALGERGGADSEVAGALAGDAGRVVEALSAMAVGHEDALCREAAVAALGSLGDDRALPAILSAAADRPAIRRRAVIALAPFDGAEVDAALQRALGDRDWQVRQAAEDLLSGDVVPGGGAK